jgi:hypothetical protein
LPSRYGPRRLPLRLLLPGTLVACAPSQSFRPAGSLLDDRSQELGLAFSSVEPRPYVNEESQLVGQLWWTKKLDERWLLTALAAVDTSPAALGGAAFRYDAFRSQRVDMAAEVEVGLFWASLSVLGSLELWHGTALYCSPRIGNWGPDVTPFIPVGLSSELFDGIALRAEAQLSWADFEGYNRRLHWGLALAHQW